MYAIRSYYATAKFADINAKDACIDVKEIEKHITDKTKCLIPVHFAGIACDMEKISKLAKKHNLYVIEDAAHAIGSDYRNEKIGSCAYSDMTIFSFHPVKTIVITSYSIHYTKLYESNLDLIISVGTAVDELAAGLGINTWNRITSYNVCYTKLLRLRPRRRDAGQGRRRQAHRLLHG